MTYPSCESVGCTGFICVSYIDFSVIVYTGGVTWRKFDRMSSELFLMSTVRWRKFGRRRKITLAYSTHKQTSDKQKVVIGNVEA